MKRLTLSGTPREIGRQHGEQGKAEIRQSLETYAKLFQGYQQIGWDEVRRRALVHLQAIKAYDSDLIEEMEGIAEGANLPFADILALNARSEIALTGREETAFNDGCTSIGLSAPISKETIIAQNWDWKATQKDSLLFLEIHQAPKPTILMVTEGGMIGKIGFNSSGIGVCLNALITDKKSAEIPIHLGLRSILNSHSLPEAMSKIQDGQMASSANFLIGVDDGSGNGMAIDVEVSPFGIDLVGGEQGKTVHSNHLCSPIIQEQIKDLNNLKYSDSMLRKVRAEQLINQSLQRGEVITEETVQRWLADTFNRPNSINHYRNELAPEHRQIETVFSIVMNVTRLEMYLCVGMPSEQPYQRYSLARKHVS